MSQKYEFRVNEYDGTKTTSSCSLIYAIKCLPISTVHEMGKTQTVGIWLKPGTTVEAANEIREMLASKVLDLSFPDSEEQFDSALPNI
jgi:hypothetical protein